MSRITIACLDMAGTTVRDDGTVLAAFHAAVGDTDPTALEYVRRTMGQSKIEVFRHILGDEDAARRANSRFEAAYAAAVRAGSVEPLPGAERVLRACRAAGVRVCLATGFSPATRDAILDRLSWRDMADLVLSPADAGRGRPWPDIPLTALLRLGGGSVRELAVIGDTPSDIESGLRAGAGLVAGVLTGAASRAELAAVTPAGVTPAAAGRAEFASAGAPLIFDSVEGLLEFL